MHLLFWINSLHSIINFTIIVSLSHFCSIKLLLLLFFFTDIYIFNSSRIFRQKVYPNQYSQNYIFYVNIFQVSGITVFFSHYHSTKGFSFFKTILCARGRNYSKKTYLVRWRICFCYVVYSHLLPNLF